MAIQTKLKSLTPRRQVYQKEIKLLSRGYSDPAWADGKLTVYPWDNTIDQWVVENARKIGKHEFVFALFQQVCDLRGGKLDNFVADEASTVLMVSRAIVNGGTVVYKSRCPSCGAAEEETIKVPDELEKVGEKAEGYPGYDIIVLPDVQDEVKIRPLLIADEKAILDPVRPSRATVLDGELRIVMRVVEINGSKPDSLEELLRWFRAVSPKDAKFLDEEGRRLTPHLNTNIPHTCDVCGKPYTFPLAFDTEFFR